jgi:hypothetical protein
LVGLVDQSHDSFAVHQIAFGESLLQGGGKVGDLAAPGENILAENVGYGDGAVDGATGADHVGDRLLLRSECDIGHENLMRTTR